MLVACGCRVFFCVVVVFLGACHWLACSGCRFSSVFVKLDFCSRASILLFVCGCRFFGAAVFVSGPVAGLLAWAAAFCEVGFFPRASSLLVACGCRVFFCVVVVFIGACHWLAWSGCRFSSVFVKLGLFSRASNLLFVHAVTGLLGQAANLREVGFL